MYVCVSVGLCFVSVTERLWVSILQRHVFHFQWVVLLVVSLYEIQSSDCVVSLQSLCDSSSGYGFFKLHLKVRVYLVLNPAFSKWEVRIKRSKKYGIYWVWIPTNGFFFSFFFSMRAISIARDSQNCQLMWDLIFFVFLQENKSSFIYWLFSKFKSLSGTALHCKGSVSAGLSRSVASEFDTNHCHCFHEHELVTFPQISLILFCLLLGSLYCSLLCTHKHISFLDGIQFRLERKHLQI